jgi:hypothetical protein
MAAFAINSWFCKLRRHRGFLCEPLVFVELALDTRIHL